MLAAYTLMLRDVVPNVAGHLLAATILQTPAAILLAKVIVPETEVPVTQDTTHVEVEKTSANVLEAAAAGASEGVQLAINVGGDADRVRGHDRAAERHRGVGGRPLRRSTA